MHILHIHDEEIYQRLMQKMHQEGLSLDQILQNLLDQTNVDTAKSDETPGQKLIHLIDETELPFEHAFDARDAEEILSRETGIIDRYPPAETSPDA